MMKSRANRANTEPPMMAPTAQFGSGYVTTPVEALLAPLECRSCSNAVFGFTTENTR